jgi:hypothetical protein
MAEVALQGCLFLLVEAYGIVRACLDAALTSRAQVVIEYNDPVLSFADRLFRAGFDTRRIVAVPT